MISGNVSNTTTDAVTSMIMNGQTVKSVQSKAVSATADSFKSVMDLSAGLTSDKSGKKTASQDDSLKKLTDNVNTGSAADKITSTKSKDKSDIKDSDKSIIEELNEQIESTVKEKLNMTDEGFSDLMSQLGLTAMDLLNPQNLTDFVVAYSGAESSIDLLTNSDLSDMYKSLTDAIMNVMTQISQSSGMSVEELTAVIDQFTQSDKLDISEVTDVVPALEDNIQDNPVKDVLASESTTASADNTDKNVDQNNVISQEDRTSEGTVTLKNVQSDAGEEESESSLGKESSNTGENIMQNLVNAFGKAMETSNVAVQTPVIDAESVITQIVDAVKVTASEQTTSMEIQLQPENLGKVNLEVIAKDGAVTAKIVAENEAVKSVIENQITALKENLNNQGLKVEAVEVTVASHTFENGMNFENRNSSEQNSSNDTRRFRDISEIPDDDSSNKVTTIEEQIQKANGNSVNYTA